MLEPRLGWGEEGRYRGGIKRPAATFQGGRIPGNRYGKAKPRKGRAVSSAAPMRSSAFGLIVEAGQVCDGMVLRYGRGNPFTVKSVSTLTFDSVAGDGSAERVQYVRINGRHAVFGDAEYSVLSYPGQRAVRDGSESFQGPAGRAYVSRSSVTDLVAGWFKLPGVTVPDFVSEWKYKYMDPAILAAQSAAFDAQFNARADERDAAGPERIAPPAEEEDDGIREFVPLADPPKRRKQPNLRLWPDFNAFQ